MYCECFRSWVDVLCYCVVVQSRRRIHAAGLRIARSSISAPKNWWKRYAMADRLAGATQKPCIAINGVCDAVTWPINHKFNVLWNGIGNSTHRIRTRLPSMHDVRNEFQQRQRNAAQMINMEFHLYEKQKGEKNNSCCGRSFCSAYASVQTQPSATFTFECIGLFCSFFYDSNCFYSFTDQRNRYSRSFEWKLYPKSII